MANNIIRRTWKQGGLVNIEDLRGFTFQDESEGHTFLISGVDADGNPMALSGSPAGVLLRPDQMDVALECAVSDGVVTATLPAECYDVPGRIGITIFLSNGDQKVCIYAAIASVSRTSSGTVSPGTTSDVVDLINRINEVVSTIPADYSYLWNAFLDKTVAEYGIVDLGTLNSGAYIKKSDGYYTNAQVWSYTNFIATGSNKALMFTCPEHSNATILSNTAAIAFYTSATGSAYISDSGIDIISGTLGDYDWIVVPVPQTAKYFRASIPNSISSSYKIIEIESVENLCQKVANIETTLDDTKVLQSIDMATSFGETGDLYADLTELPDYSLCRTTNAPDRPYWIAANNGFWVLTARPKNYNTKIQIGFAARTGEMAIRYKGTSTSAYTDWVANGSRKSVRVLCIGNSYTCDNIGYMPYILENITPDIDLYLTIAFYPSSSIDDHIAAFDDDTVSYFKCVHEPGATAWVRPAERDATLKQILASEQWDFITFQQASSDQSTWSTYANLNTLIDKVVGYVNGLGNHSVRLGWFMPHIRKSIETASSYSDMIQCVQNVLSTTPIDFVIPCGTAVQNARGTSLDSFGDSGHLTYDSNGHLQEGLPCMIGAYTVVIKLLELCGMAYMGIMGEGTLPTSTWLTGKYIPNPQGSSVGATTANCYIAQKCAVAAVKKPYDVTQITE